MTVRYAIYFAPARESQLWRAGCRWLGRDAESGECLQQPAVAGWLPQHVYEWTGAPRRYGFHATLKAPFRLAEGRTEAQLHAALQAFAAHEPAFRLPSLAVAELGEFLALRPCESSPALNAFAARCVTQFDDFRRPADPAETDRRMAAGLTGPQQALLARWGYPFVLDEFRFHLTLTDRLALSDRSIVQPWLADHLATMLAAPLWLDQLALFVEQAHGTPFVLTKRFTLRG